MIKKLPFYWRLKEKGSPNIVHDFRPFNFDFDESNQLIIQQRNAEILKDLESIYKAEYNIGYLQDANEIAKPYGADFLLFIEKVLNTEGSHIRDVLEVGCGGCTILSQLKDQGFNVIGIDPSPIASRDGAKKGIVVINDFFPTSSYTDKVDLIFHSDVLEHVQDPVNFLKDQKSFLNENGIIIISIPDCTESIQLGDLSMVIHQHLNYFDSESLKNVVENAGLKVLTIETAKYGGSLYCAAQNKDVNCFVPFKGREKFEVFSSRVKTNTQFIVDFIKSLKVRHKSIGFYVPLRTLPFLAYLGELDGVRFFDDTAHWHNRSFDGTEIYIENFSDLKSNPVDELFIMSLSFADVIERKVQSKISEVQNIYKLRELLKTSIARY